MQARWHSSKQIGQTSRSAVSESDGGSSVVVVEVVVEVVVVLQVEVEVEVGRGGVGALGVGALGVGVPVASRCRFLRCFLRGTGIVVPLRTVEELRDDDDECMMAQIWCSGC